MNGINAPNTSLQILKSLAVFGKQFGSCGPNNIFPNEVSLFQLLPVFLSLSLKRKQLLFHCFPNLFDLTIMSVLVACHYVESE